MPGSWFTDCILATETEVPLYPLRIQLPRDLGSITHASGDSYTDLNSAVDPEVVFEPALALSGCSVGAIGGKAPPNSGRLKILKWPCNWAPAHPSHNLETILPVQGPYWRHFCVSGSLSVVLRVQGPSRRRSHLCIWWSGKALILYSPPLPVTDHATDTPICAQRDPEMANTWTQSPQSHTQQSWGSRVPEGNIPSYKPDYSERALCSAPASPTANCEEYCWHRNPAGDIPVCTPRNPYTGYQPLPASIH